MTYLTPHAIIFPLLMLLATAPFLAQAQDEQVQPETTEPAAYGVAGPLTEPELIALLVQATAVTDRTLEDEVVAGRVVAVVPELRIIVIESGYDGLLQLRTHDEPLVVRKGAMQAYEAIAAGDWVAIGNSSVTARTGVFRGFEDGHMLFERNGFVEQYELSHFAQLYNEERTVRPYQLPRGETATILIRDGRALYLNVQPGMELAVLGTIRGTSPFQPLIDILPFVALALLSLGGYLVLQKFELSTFIRVEYIRAQIQRMRNVPPIVAAMAQRATRRAVKS